MAGKIEKKERTVSKEEDKKKRKEEENSLKTRTCVIINIGSCDAIREMCDVHEK